MNKFASMGQGKMSAVDKARQEVIETALQTGASPYRQFSVLVAVGILTGALFVATFISVAVQRFFYNETERVLKDAVGTHFRYVFGEDIFSVPFDEGRLKQFDGMVRGHLNLYHVVDARFYNLNGEIVYSYVPDQVGARPVTESEVQRIQAALGGATTTEQTTFTPEDAANPLPDAQPAYEQQEAMGEYEADEYRAPTHAMRGAEQESIQEPTVDRSNAVRSHTPTVAAFRITVPVMEGANVVGVAEVVRTADKIRQAVRRIQGVSFALMGAGALLLFFSMRRIFQTSTQKILKQSSELRKALCAVEEVYDATLESLSAALDARDSETEGHARRVTAYATAIAIELNVGGQALVDLARGALLHDVGKIGIPDAVLCKRGPLTPEEWHVMRRHSELGYAMLSHIKFLRESLPVVLFHHERFDGKGYPRGLAGEEIPLSARIFSVADALDAITSNRPYRSAASFEEAKLEILRHSGTQFDPVVVQALERIPVERLRSMAAQSVERDSLQFGAVGAVAVSEVASSGQV